MKSSFFSLVAIANAAIITQTEWNTMIVTVGADGQVIGAPSTSTSDAPAPTTSSTSTPPVNNYVWTPSTSSSSTSTSSSTSSTSTTTSSDAPQATSTLDSFQADIINYHNNVRAQHQVGDVTWDATLASYAQNYLDNSNCVFAHSGGPYGENIALGYPTTDGALDAWYNEEDLYDYAAGQFGENTGHFTQMVWKGTDKVGCATIDCSGSTYLACEYSPRGNIIGYFTQNVFPKSS